MSEQTRSACYEIRVRGRLGEMLLAAFPDMLVEPSEPETVLIATLPDQAALHGVLSRVEALNLELLEVRRTQYREERLPA
jgi:hypothetical protein